MRASPAEYLRLNLRAHDLLRGVPLYDVSIVDLPRLSEGDRRDSELPSGTPVGSFLLLYQFPGEALSETRNATVHGYVCTALAPTGAGTVCTGGST
jgi:hypothetical protein